MDSRQMIIKDISDSITRKNFTIEMAPKFSKEKKAVR